MMMQTRSRWRRWLAVPLVAGLLVGLFLAWHAPPAPSLWLGVWIAGLCT
jgi:hypothetical protein